MLGATRCKHHHLRTIFSHNFSAKCPQSLLSTKKRAGVRSRDRLATDLSLRPVKQIGRGRQSQIPSLVPPVFQPCIGPLSLFLLCDRLTDVAALSDPASRGEFNAAASALFDQHFLGKTGKSRDVSHYVTPGAILQDLSIFVNMAQVSV